MDIFSFQEHQMRLYCLWYEMEYVNERSVIDKSSNCLKMLIICFLSPSQPSIASQSEGCPSGPAQAIDSTASLWADVATNDHDWQAIDIPRSEGLSILIDLQKQVKHAKNECITKRWKYTRKSGETIIFRDIFDKITKWIDLFKQIGDAAVQYDPVHAALPWAGVRFLLQVKYP